MGFMQQILLSRGYKCYVDDVVYPFFGCHNWCAHDYNGWVHGVRSVMVNGMDFQIYLFRQILGVPWLRVEWLDGNRLNYCSDNMRIKDRFGNRYSWYRFNGESRYKGIVWDKYYGLWRAEYCGLVIGYYITEVDAIRARNVKMEEIHPGAKHYQHKIPILRKYFETVDAERKAREPKRRYNIQRSPYITEKVI